MEQGRALRRAALAALRVPLLTLLLPPVLLAPSAVGAAPADPDPDASPRVRAFRSEEAPQIDGRLDEAMWQRAPQIPDLTQVDPVEGGVPTEKTEVWIAYDAGHLYLAVRCHDSDPSGIVAKQMTQDTDQRSDDRINLVFDTFLDQRNAYFFQFTPLGTRSEALLENNETFRRPWDTIWHAESRIDEHGWTAEMALPFQSVGFAPGQSEWGFEIERIIRRKNEKARWANASRNRSITNVAGIGVIEGLEDIRASGVDAKPTLSGSWRRDHATRDFDRIGRSGLDVFWKPVSSVTGALTLNTDFSDAPVDDRQVNLSRFALFFPETRDFFLQDAGIFEFAGLEQNGRPFFSRRVGFTNGRVVNLDGGVKVTGRVGNLNFGALEVRTAHEAGLHAQDLGVARLQLNVLGESQLGLIATHGSPQGGDENNVLGADFRYRNSRVAGSHILTGDLWLLRSQSGGTNAREAAFGARLEYPNDRYNGLIGYTEIQENYRPALGFVNRTGIRQYDGNFRYRMRPRRGPFRTVDFGFENQIITDRDDDLRSRILTWNLVEFTTHPGDKLRLTYIAREERPVRAFAIRDAFIPAGEYPFDQFQLSLETSLGRPLAADLEFSWGEFYGGRLTRAIARLELRPIPQLFASLEWDQSDGRLPERVGTLGGVTRTWSGDFTTRLLRLRLNLNFTPEMSWTNVVQYDNASDTIGWNSRFRWEVRSGNEIFLIFNQGWHNDTSSIGPLATDATAKLAWTFRY